MLRAISHARHSDAEPFGTLILDAGDRHLRRKLVTTNQGDKLTIDLPEAVLFADGDFLILNDGRAIEIIAAKEKLYEVKAGEATPLRHLAWHLGNRHLAAQIDEDRILIQRDHVIRDMLVGLGAGVNEVIEQFQPVHGAYHSHVHGDAHSSAHSHSHAHSHSESHSHSHGHSHDHAHSHSQAHDPDSHQRGKRDKYGRLPGDPHYGHNHG